MSKFYPIKHTGSIGKVLLVLLLMYTLAGCTGSESSVLTQTLSEPLGSVTSAKIDIDPGDGNLIVDQLSSSDQELASGELQYLENQEQPTHTVDTSGSLATLTLKASPTEQPWIRLPWAACNGATEWRVYLNPGVASDVAAHTDGGNVKLNLAGTVVTRLMADTGGGNIDVALPAHAANLYASVKTGAGNVTVAIASGITGSSTVSASSGAGNVVVRLPGGIAARIHTSSGMGKITVDTLFNKVDDITYQSNNYDTAADRIEITANSGAGNVTIETD
jgi:hypothetical protein